MSVSTGTAGTNSTIRPILFVDNQDSFVWNLVDYVSQFYEETAVRSNRITLAEVAAMQPLGIVISPGPGHPANLRDIGSCLEIIKQFGKTPILGVCLGHQAMNIAYGGTISHTKPLHGKTSEIRHDGKGIFRGLENPIVGGRYHSLAIEKLSTELEQSAKTADGIIMGLRHKNRPHDGLQFHPESVLTPSGKKLIANWIEDVVGCIR
jgi:anthranilate synthase component 2